MNEQPSDEDRQSLIADARADASRPTDPDELALFADILSDPSVWADPRASLEDDVVDAVVRAPAAATRPSRRRIVWSSVAAAAAIVIVLLAAFGVFSRSSSPDYRAALRGGAFAPNASASVDVDRNNAGFRLTLDAHGLPALRAGQYYQAWLKNDANVLVPIGTFSSSDGRVTLWSGVSPADYPTITVTIEQADNNQDSSGHRVLSGVARRG